LRLALDTSMLWNRYCIVYLSIVVHGRAIPLVWRTLVHSSASISAEISIEMLKKADQMLADFGPITLLADRGFPSAELLSWFDDQPRWTYVMRICSDTWINGTAAPMGCELRRLQGPCAHFRRFQDGQLWVSGNQKANLLLNYPTGIPVDEPWTLIRYAHPSLDLVWSYAQRFCCEQLFRDQKSGLFQLESSGLRCPLLMMTSGGGLTDLATAAAYPIRLVESGPAGGAILAARLAAEALGLRVHGTLGVLVRSIRAGRRTKEEILAILRELPGRSSLHISRGLLAEVVERVYKGA
jgi:hypothetical protein